jgi:hypothetical protein
MIPNLQTNGLNKHYLTRGTITEMNAVTGR